MSDHSIDLSHLALTPGDRRRRARPVSITSVALSPEQEFRARQRRYAILMGTRAVCVVAATLVYHVALLLSLAFITGGAVLPWCAVLIANHRLPLKYQQRPAPVPVGVPRALPVATDSRTIEL